MDSALAMARAKYRCAGVEGSLPIDVETIDLVAIDFDGFTECLSHALVFPCLAKGQSAGNSHRSFGRLDRVCALLLRPGLFLGKSYFCCDRRGTR